MYVTLPNQFLNRLEADETSLIPLATSHLKISTKPDTSNGTSTLASPEDLLRQIDSLICQERKKRKRPKMSYKIRTNPLKAKRKLIQVPIDPEYPEGDWTEGELGSSSDSDTT
nr:MAG: ORF3 [Torque teno polar bear virus 35]